MNNADQRQAIIANVNAAVKLNMPPKLSAHAAENKVEKKQKLKTPIPAEMIAMLDEVLAWRRVKAETSIPVKKAAEGLKNAKDDKIHVERIKDGSP